MTEINPIVSVTVSQEVASSDVAASLAERVREAYIKEQNIRRAAVLVGIPRRDAKDILAQIGLLQKAPSDKRIAPTGRNNALETVRRRRRGDAGRGSQRRCYGGGNDGFKRRKKAPETRCLY